MQVQTPFYVIKRTAVTKEAAMAEWLRLSARHTTTVQQNSADLIDFCLSGPKEEAKVFLSIGDKVLLKANAGWAYRTPTIGAAVLTAVTLECGRLLLQFDTDGDYNAVHTTSADLSAYVELI